MHLDNKDADGQHDNVMYMQTMVDPNKSSLTHPTYKSQCMENLCFFPQEKKMSSHSAVFVLVFSIIQCFHLSIQPAVRPTR